ncbi:hypothetical protein ABVT39_018890 [Epinephelus coioides]
MKQSSLINYFKKPRLDFQQDTSSTAEEDVSPSPSTSRPTTPPTQASEATHTMGNDAANVTVPDDPNTATSGITDLSTVDEPACQPKLQAFPATEAHEASKAHASAVARHKGYTEIQRAGNCDIIHQVTKDKQERFIDSIERNRAHVKAVIDILLFCAKQGIALRGHKEDTESLNRRNVLELFKLICDYDPDIKKRFDELPNNAKMMSPDIQNDLLETAASLLLRKIKAELHAETDKYYAILADEYKDLSKKELIAVCLTYVYNGNLRERAVGFVATNDMTSSGITKKILEVLEPLQLDPELCVGFSFDGAAVMSGEHRCVCSLLKPAAACSGYSVVPGRAEHVGGSRTSDDDDDDDGLGLDQFGDSSPPQHGTGTAPGRGRSSGQPGVTVPGH